MKTLLSCIAFTAIIFMSSFTISQQKELNSSYDSSFTGFKAHRQGKAAIALDWSVNSTDITQFIVERSYDGDFFEAVSTMNFNGSSGYKYKDTNVYPGVIYYRITALRSDGSTETSTVETVRIVQH